MTTEDHDRLYDMLKRYRASVERLHGLISADEWDMGDILFVIDEGADLNPNDYESDDGSGVSEDADIDSLTEAARMALDESPLSVEGIWKGPNKEDADYVGCQVVFATGGPHIELDTTRNVWVGLWGGDKCELSADPDLCEYFDGFVEGL